MDTNKETQTEMKETTSREESMEDLTMKTMVTGEEKEQPRRETPDTKGAP